MSSSNQQKKGLKEKGQNKKSVIVVGGGWAGLSTAVALSDAGYGVTVLEGSKQLGGRARSLKMGEQWVDNGQHLMLGAYTHMLALMQSVGVDERDVFLRQKLRLNVQCLNGSQFDLSAPNLPAPIHLLVAFLRCKGLNFKEKITGLISMDKLMKTKLSIEQDCSVQDILTRCKVPQNVQDKLQIPLCIAALNTQAEHASARVFIAVLNEAFKTSRAASDLLIATKDLDHILANPVQNYLTQKGHTVLLGQRVTKLLFSEEVNENSKAIGVACQKGTPLMADHIVIATQYNQAQQLLKRDTPDSLSPLRDQLLKFKDEPIVTLYYQFPDTASLPNAMTGMMGGYGEWVFDRAFAGQKGLLAVVISASGEHLNFKHSELSEKVLKELQAIWPELPEPDDVLVVKESRATFHCGIGVDGMRPSNQTPVSNLWLAADYTDTKFPATLEGAVRSANTCAQAIIQSDAGSI